MMSTRPTESCRPHGISGLGELARIPFNQIAPALQRRAYSVRYAELEDRTGGLLWVTRHGWPYLAHLDPARWYFDQQYLSLGKQLSDGTGAVFRVPGLPSARPCCELVVKFSRMAQEIVWPVASLALDQIPAEVVDNANFNDPFKEFGLLDELRGSTFGPPDQRVFTKRPLAIYCPSQRFDPWQLGRSFDRFRPHKYQLRMDQAAQHPARRVELSIERRYVILFQWVRGVDAQQLVEHGALSRREALALVQRVNRDLAAKGFRVLDTKPNHIVLRIRNGRPLRRRDRLVYALVDFELLQRTEEYEAWRKQRKLRRSRRSGPGAAGARQQVTEGT